MVYIYTYHIDISSYSDYIDIDGVHKYIYIWIISMLYRDCFVDFLMFDLGLKLGLKKKHSLCLSGIVWASGCRLDTHVNLNIYGKSGFLQKTLQTGCWYTSDIFGICTNLYDSDIAWIIYVWDLPSCNQSWLPGKGSVWFDFSYQHSHVQGISQVNLYHPGANHPYFVGSQECRGRVRVYMSISHSMMIFLFLCVSWICSVAPANDRNVMHHYFSGMYCSIFLLNIYLYIIHKMYIYTGSWTT